MVRSRMREHLEALQLRFVDKLGGYEILENTETDYGFRLVIHSDTWQWIVGELAKEQTWSNFKNEVGDNPVHRVSGYEDALHDVWSTMYRLQVPLVRRVFDIMDWGDAQKSGPLFYRSIQKTKKRKNRII